MNIAIWISRVGSRWARRDEDGDGRGEDGDGRGGRRGVVVSGWSSEYIVSASCRQGDANCIVQWAKQIAAINIYAVSYISYSMIN